jgi:hypothetical protein
MKEGLVCWLLILFLIVVLGIAGHMECADRDALKTSLTASADGATSCAVGR